MSTIGTSARHDFAITVGDERLWVEDGTFRVTPGMNAWVGDQDGWQKIGPDGIPTDPSGVQYVHIEGFTFRKGEGP